MEKFITIKDIQDCLKMKGIIWDGKKGRTQYGLGEEAVLEDFQDDNFVPVRVGFEDYDESNEFEFLLKIYNTSFYIYEEKYHPHDDDYIVPYQNFIIEWKKVLLKDHQERYAQVLANEIQEEIDMLQESFDEDFKALKLQMKELEDNAVKAIGELKAKKEKILALFSDETKEK